MQPEQVEAHAAQGYSLPDVARLLGVPPSNLDWREHTEAFARGAQRWREAGQSIPQQRVTDIITQAVHSLLLGREMTRPQLREALGFQHADLNLAIETLEQQFLIDHEEDGLGTSYYRAAGTPSPIAEKRRGTANVSPALTRGSVVLETVSQPTGNNETNEMSQPVANSNGDGELAENKPEKISARSDRQPICVDCGGPRSMGSGQRCMKCFKAKVEANQRPPRVEADAVDAAHREGEARVREIVAGGIVKTDLPQESEQNITQAITPCGCGRPNTHMGRCSYRRAQAGGDFPAPRSKKTTSGRPREPRGYKVFDPQKESAAMNPTNSSKFGISVTAEIRRIVEALPVNTETDTPRLLAMLLAVFPTLKTHPELDRLKTYISQAVWLMKGKTLKVLRKGQGGEADLLCRVEESGDPIPKSEQLAVRKPAVPARRTAAAEVYGGVRLHEEIQVRVEEMANWPKERITEFFEALAKVVEIPQRAVPLSIKPAWSKDFEIDDSPEGMQGMALFYLNTMLHESMSETEKNAVWCLILWLKRMQAASERAKEGR